MHPTRHLTTYMLFPEGDKDPFNTSSSYSYLSANSKLANYLIRRRDDELSDWFEVELARLPTPNVAEEVARRSGLLRLSHDLKHDVPVFLKEDAIRSSVTRFGTCRGLDEHLMIEQDGAGVVPLFRSQTHPDENRKIQRKKNILTSPNISFNN